MSNEVLEILEKTNGLLKGHFCLTSGLHSDEYFQCAKLYQYPEYTEKIGQMIAQKLSGIEFDMFTCSISFIKVGVSICSSFLEKYSVITFFLFSFTFVLAIQRLT